ncbi:MAG: glycosyltransferase [Patescibacteria group bacterium]
MHRARKKVLFLITKSNFGGAQRYVFDVATHLPPSFEPIVAFGGTGVVGADTGLLNTMLAERGIRTIHLRSLGRDISLVHEWKSFKEIMGVIKSEQPDILHLNSSKAGGLGALAGRIAGIRRIVYTAHGWPFWEKRPYLQTKLILFFSWLTALLSHIVVCVSEFDQSHMHSFPFMKNRLTVIKNGIVPPSFFVRTEARRLIPTHLGAMHTDALWVVSIAELTPNKNLTTGIKAVAQYNTQNTQKIFYTIIGSGEMREELEDISRAHAISDSIYFAGFVPNAAHYLKAFDAFLLPSLKEGLPYAILEALSAHIPVIASNVGGIPEIAAREKSVTLVDPSDTQTIVAAFKMLQKNPELLTTEDVLSDWNIERMMADTISLYTV